MESFVTFVLRATATLALIVIADELIKIRERMDLRAL